MNGMVNMVTTLVIAVRVIDNAVSAFAKRESRLEVGPPGLADSIIIPTATSGEAGSNDTNRYAIKGSRIN